MFRFANPIYLYLLILIPLLVLAYILLFYRKRRQFKQFGDLELMKSLMPDVSNIRHHVKFSLMMLALTLIIFMLARPQYGIKTEEYKRSGIEAIVAVDVSNSMLCEDVAPSRLQKAKMIVSKLVEQLDEDRVGLIAFAGNAVTLLPLTQDGVSAKMFLEQLNTQTVSLQGTNMSEAIQRAIAGFSASESKEVGRALIFITDAEDNEEGAEEMARDAQKMGIKIFVLSVGTVQGGPIPLGGGRFKKDLSGNTVITHLNEEAGKALAKAGNGVYLHVDQTDNAQAMLEAEISNMQKEDFKSSAYSEYDEQFIAVAILLLVVLIIEICVMDKKNNWFRRFKIHFGVWPVMVGCWLVMASVSAQTPKENTRLGNYHYRDGQFDKAEVYYKKSLERDSTMEALYNLGNAQLAQGRDSDAFVSYQKALQQPSASTLKKAMIYHNMGNIMYASALMHMKSQDGQANESFGHAVELFKGSLRNNPNSNETRYNLAMAQYMFKKTQNDPNQNNQNNKDKNKDNKNQDKKEQNKDQQNQNKEKNKDDKKEQQDKQNQQNQDKKDAKEQPSKPEQANPAQPKKDEMDEQTAEQLLNSAQQDEKKVQKKLIKQPQQRRSLDKDW